MKQLFLTIIFGSLTLAGLSQEVMHGKVIEVLDGNTVLVLTESEEKPYKILLYEIDSPELNQAYGPESKSYLSKLLFSKKVTVTIHAKDRYGNLLGIILNGKKDARIDLLEAGYAWTSEKNPNPTLEKYRHMAQENRKGLWQETNPTPPWIFRRQQTMIDPKSR
jgi:micrococcal nuclease